MTDVLTLATAAGWGGLAAAAVVVVLRRRHRRARVRDLRSPSGTGRSRRKVVDRLVARSGPVAAVVRGLRDARRRRRGDERLRRETPVAIDLLGVAVGAGATPYLAIGITARWAPPAVAVELARIGDECRLGRPLRDALEALGQRRPPLAPLADALASSDRLGAPIGPALTRLAEEARADTRRRAEQRARALPVRLLFPLVFLVLPAFGLLTVVPALLTGLART